MPYGAPRWNLRSGRLLGHSTGTMTERYGLGHDVKALAEAVALVRYAGVKLPG